MVFDNFSYTDAKFFWDGSQVLNSVLNYQVKNSEVFYSVPHSVFCCNANWEQSWANGTNGATILGLSKCLYPTCEKTVESSSRGKYWNILTVHFKVHNLVLMCGLRDL